MNAFLSRLDNNRTAKAALGFLGTAVVSALWYLVSPGTLLGLLAEAHITANPLVVGLVLAVLSSLLHRYAPSQAPTAIGITPRQYT